MILLRNVTIDAQHKVLVWQGEVKIVPFLHAPGFCNAQAPGLGEKSHFPDASGRNNIVISARTFDDSALSHFNVMLETKGAKHLFRQGQYSANFTLSSEMQDIQIPLDNFVCTWRGEHVTWCPPIAGELKQITNIGVGTAFPGKAGKFAVDLKAIAAM